MGTARGERVTIDWARVSRLSKTLIRKMQTMLLIIVSDAIRFDLLRQAAAMAYVTLLTIVPALAVVFVLVSLFSPLTSGHHVWVASLKRLLLENLTSSSGLQAAEFIDSLLVNLNLRRIGVSGFIGFLFTLVILLRNIEIVFNRIWMIAKERSLFLRFVYFWTFLTLGFFAISLAVGFTIGGVSVEHLLTTQGRSLLGSVGGSTFVAIVCFFFLYRLVPNCFVSYKASLAGALLATLFFGIASKGFAIYITHIANFNNIYGTIGVLPVFLLWLFISWIVVLLGGVIARRIDQGWHDSGHYPFGSKKPGERFKRARARIILPVLVLIYLYKDFVTSTGNPRSGLDICERFALPKFWVAEALKDLVDKKLIWTGSGVSDEKDEAYLRQQFFPARLPEALSVATVTSGVLEPPWEWLSDWQEQIGPEYLVVLRNVLATESEAAASTSLKDCLTADALDHSPSSRRDS